MAVVNKDAEIARLTRALADREANDELMAAILAEARRALATVTQERDEARASEARLRAALEAVHAECETTLPMSTRGLSLLDAALAVPTDPTPLAAIRARLDGGHSTQCATHDVDGFPSRFTAKETCNCGHDALTALFGSA